MARMAIPMTPPTTETMMVVKVVSISFTAKRERGKDLVREKEGAFVSV